MNSAYPLIHHVLCFNLTWCDNLIGVFWAGDTCHPILFSVFFTNLPSHTFLIEGTGKVLHQKEIKTWREKGEGSTALPP
ncbi:hypothetical protein HanHA89_Chr01g0012161 [Helianthus annuus]|nr:hypothetical protein HanHA89_Chr01g0012161 [Helianthus annuus]